MPPRLRAGLIVALLAAGGCAGEQSPPDLYVAGFESNDTVYIAMLWKNGSPVPLSDGVLGAKAFAVALSGPDVYVAGVASDGTLVVPTVWRNGVPETLDHGTAYGAALAMAVSGKTVYVAGVLGGAPTLWTDGVAMPLSDEGGAALAVAVDGEAVYAAGYRYVTDFHDGGFWHHPQALYWVNGDAHPLTGAGVNAGAYAIAVSRGDVHVGGWMDEGNGQLAVVWSNGAAQPLTDGVYAAGVYGLALEGEHMIAAGSEDNGDALAVAKLWRDGRPVDLTSGDAWYGFAYAVAVHGGSTYAAGVQGDSSAMSRAMMWTDGVPRTLTDGVHDAAAMAIAVSGR